MSDTPKSIVLRTFPDAWAYRWNACNWTVYAARTGALRGINIGEGSNSRTAWQSAARKTAQLAKEQTP